jgi:hypothetical protein
MVWDPKTKLDSSQFHVMFADNFDTVQAPNPNIKHADTMECLFKTNSYTYDYPFGNEHTYLFSHGGVARDTKEIELFVKTLRDDYKLTLNDPNPINDF